VAERDQFIHPVVCATTYHPDGTVDTGYRPAMWVLAHRGYSGSGRLDLWGYRSHADALWAGAELALASGLDEDPHAVDLFEVGHFAELLAYYEQKSPASHVLRVEAAFLHGVEEDDGYEVPPFAALFGAGSGEEDEEEVVLTARDAAVLWDCALERADDAVCDIEAFGDAPVTEDGTWLIFDEFPGVTFGQSAHWRRQAARAFLDLADDLAAGQLPLPRCPAEELALHLILDAADGWADDPDAHPLRIPLADIPARAEDHDWEALRDTLFRDHDILALYDPAAAGIEDPADPRNQAITMGDYRTAAWFTWFASAQPRDPNRPTP